MEEWRTVEGYDGSLEVSSLGRVRSLPSIRAGIRNGVPHIQRKRGVVMSPFVAKNGYLHIAPKFGPSRKKLLTHRLIAKAFVPGWFEGATVNHKDGDKLNNLPSNLEWVSLAENTRLQWRDGLVDLRGEKHPSAKLTNSEVVQIKRRLDAGEVQTMLAREFSVSVALISKIRRGAKKVPTF